MYRSLSEDTPNNTFLFLSITHSSECDYYNTLIVCGKENRLNLVKKLDYYWILMVKNLDSVSLKIDHQPEMVIWIFMNLKIFISKSIDLFLDNEYN
jgi:hypothetical protein